MNIASVTFSFILLLVIEVFLYVIIFCRRTKIAKKIIRLLAKLQDIPLPITMREIDTRLEKMVKEDEKK